MLEAPILLLLAVVLGGIAQRSTGMGFALASAPLAIIAIGPLQGVLMMNLLGIPAATMALVLLWRRIEWPTVFAMILPCVIGVFLGVQFLSLIDPAYLEFGLGIALLLAVIITLRAPALPASRSLTVPSVITGFSAGFLNAVASIGGPPLVVYRNLRKWPVESFTPTIQPLLITMSGSSFLVKSLTGAVAVPMFSLGAWLSLAVALSIGLIIGQQISKRLSMPAAGKAITLIAVIGSIATLIRGLISLL